MAKFFYLDDYIVNSDFVRAIELVHDDLEYSDDIWFLKVSLSNKCLIGELHDSYEEARKEFDDLHDYLVEA